MEPQPTPSRTNRLASLAAACAARAAGWFRPVLISVTIVAFFYVAYGYVRLFSEWRQAAQPTATPSAATTEVQPLAGVLPLDGPWVFGDLNWNLKSAKSNREDVEALLDRLEAAPIQDDANLPALNKDLLELINSTHRQPVERNGCQVYQLSNTNLKCQLVVRLVERQPRVVSFAGGYALNGQEWQSFELVPTGISSRTGTAVEHLLPLPANAVRRGGRFSQDGRLLLELVALKSSADSLINDWRHAGWEVRPSGLNMGNSFSYLCRHGNEVIYAWSADTNESLETIMLVRSPADDELRAQRSS
jgi:hypothetical protein